VDQRPPAITNLSSDSSRATSPGSVHLTWTNTWTNDDAYGNYFGVYAVPDYGSGCPAAADGSWGQAASNRYQAYGEQAWDASNLTSYSNYCFRVDMCNAYGCTSSNVISASPVDAQTACGNSGQYWCTSWSAGSSYSFCASDAASCSETQASDGCSYNGQYWVSSIQSCVNTQAEANCRNSGYNYYWSDPACFFSSGEAAATQSGNFWYGGTSSNRTQSQKLSFSQISVGAYHACGLTSGGALYCWGTNYWNNLVGDPTAPISLVPPVATGGNRTFSSVAVGQNYSCALESGTGDAYCWGVYANSPTKIVGQNFSQIDIGAAEACGISAGSLYCWSYNTPTPARFGDSSDWTQVSLGSSHKCALNTSGVAYCWGYNGNFQLGSNPGASTNTPTAVTMPSGETFSQISARGNTTCALTPGGAAYCWGDNSSNQAGPGGSSQPVVAPTLVSAQLSFTKISTGGTTCAVTGAGELYCWGNNIGGTPALGNSRITWSSVASGYGDSCAIGSASSGGSVFCWGGNGNGYGLYGSPNSSVSATFSDPAVIPATRPSCDYDFSTLRCRNHTSTAVTDFQANNNVCATSLTWSSTGADYYNIYRNWGMYSAPVDPNPINAAPITSTSYSDSDLSSTDYYTYEIEGCDYLYGCSGRSSASTWTGCSD